MAQLLSQPDILQHTQHLQRLVEVQTREHLNLAQQQQQLVNPNIIVTTLPQSSLYGADNKSLTVQAPSSLNAGGASVLASGTSNLNNGKTKKVKKQLYSPVPAAATAQFTQPQKLALQQMQALTLQKPQQMYPLPTSPYNAAQFNVSSAPLLLIYSTLHSISYSMVSLFSCSSLRCLHLS